MKDELKQLLTICLREYASDAGIQVSGFDGATVLYGVTEGKTNKEALRALKRRISNAVYRHLAADQQRTTS